MQIKLKEDTYNFKRIAFVIGKCYSFVRFRL
nr:MAG TPA: hypothetical protein [Caudoviricetes sp.]